MIDIHEFSDGERERGGGKLQCIPVMLGAGVITVEFYSLKVFPLLEKWTYRAVPWRPKSSCWEGTLVNHRYD